MDLLKSNVVCVLTGDEFLPKSGMTFVEQVTAFFKSQGGTANSPFGTVLLDKKGVKNSKQHGNSRIKSASFAAIKDVLEKGIVILPSDYYGTNDKKQKTCMVAAPIQIGGEKYVCVVVVIDNSKFLRLYVHESFPTKNLQEVVASSQVRGSKTSSPQPIGDVAKVLYNFLISKQNQEEAPEQKKDEGLDASKDNKEQNSKNITESKSNTTPILNESKIRRIVGESIRKVLNENARDKRVLDYLKSRGYSDYDTRMRIIGGIKHDIPNIRLDSSKFLLGLCRMYLDGQLRDEQSIRKVDNALKFIHVGGHTGEFDENLNGKSPDELHEMFREASKQLGIYDRERSNNQVFNGGIQYRIIPINSYEEAKPYGKYTSWCVTHSKSAFNSYTQGGNRFYFCLKDGFENVPKDNDGAPLNEWGLSMIAVNIDMNGDLTRTTTRYNHDFNGENNPELETTEQLEKVLNVPFYQTFKPYTREELHAMGIILFDEVQELLDTGTPPEKIFQKVGDFLDGFARVELDGKRNFISQGGKLLSDTWFDNVKDFSNGIARVELNDKYNLINQEGKVMSDTWFEYIYDFSEGVAEVVLNDKYNYISREGRLLSDTWFDYAGEFQNGFGQVDLDVQSNFINQEGKFLSDTWFDEAGGFQNGFAKVKLNNKYNYINQECKLMSDTWFDNVKDFSNGIARVELNGQWYYIDSHGNLYDEKPSIQENRSPIKITESDIRMLVSEAVERLLN